MARIFHLLSRAALLLAAAGPASAATLEVAAYQADGRPVADAVVTLRGPADAPQGVLKADMDQRGQRFAPHVLAVHTGTQVRFPNSDNIRHQVYSFSAAKRFELRLYEGTPTDPLLFDKPGVVVLGCNIHDWMLGYIYVTDDPRFGVSDVRAGCTWNNCRPATTTSPYGIRNWRVCSRWMAAPCTSPRPASATALC